MMTLQDDLPPPGLPIFRGLSWQREDHFSFLIPLDWLPFEWADRRQGVIYGPTAADPHTFFAAAEQNLGINIQPDDFPHLEKGFLEGIRALPEVHIEQQEKRIEGDLIILDARYSFQQGPYTLKRWTRVYYWQIYQITFTAQAHSPEWFAYWLPMYFQAMMTIQIHASKPALASW